MSPWKDKRVLVTGGASFIGSHLVEALLAQGADVRVIDDLSSGTRQNLEAHIRTGALEFIQADLRDPGAAAAAAAKREVVFHLAAIHGGRGFVDLHPADCAQNLVLDGNLFQACRQAGVRKIVYASSGCIYPNYLQANPGEELYLQEASAGPPYDADNLYGWAKLMGEMSLRAFVKDWGIEAVSCRYFTVYGERGLENHAIMAMIARAFIRQSPFEVWGNGEQIRNWTYVGDIVSGTLLAGEKIADGSAINLGTMERTRVRDAVRAIMEYTGFQAEVLLQPEMPTGPMNRVADNRLARERLGWEPATPFAVGLRRTVDWYFAHKQRDQVRATLDQLLTQR
ncbi:MAG: NAD-dependent epimerase/dehydratase family protein [Candidatus Sericytochromatia bacterium]